MKDRQTLEWLYQNAKPQLPSLLTLIAGNAVFAVCGVLFALAARGAIDGAVAGQMGGLVAYGAGLAAVIMLQLALRLLCGSLTASMQGRLEMHFKTGLLGNLLTKDYTCTSKYHSGELMSRLTGDVTVVTEGLGTLAADITFQLTRLVSALTVLCVIDPFFSLIFIAAGLALFFTAKYFRQRLKYLHKNVQEKDGWLHSLMQELLESMVVVKTFGAERAMQAKTAALGRELYQAKMKKSAAGIMANSGFSFVFSLGYLYALVWSAVGIMHHTISFGTLTAILQLVGQVQTPFAGLSGLLPKVYGVIASAERLMELENLPQETALNREAIPRDEVYRHMRSLELKNVSFRYDRDPVLTDVDLTIHKGEFAVIAGQSGIGKSTLLLLLLGVFAPDSGTIEIVTDTGEKIPADRHTRGLFAYVPQGNYMLSGTIRDSIAFVHSQVADAEIMAAAEVSCAAEFIRALPQGLDTVIGEKGLGLSEGQVQRLAIARAVLCGAPVLLLDEATSALDESTEAQLLENIRQMTDRTCLIVSHKKAAFAICNQAVGIYQGRLQQMGRSETIAGITA